MLWGAPRRLSPRGLPGLPKRKAKAAAAGDGAEPAGRPAKRPKQAAAAAEEGDGASPPLVAADDQLELELDSHDPVPCDARGARIVLVQVRRASSGWGGAAGATCGGRECQRRRMCCVWLPPMLCWAHAALPRCSMRTSGSRRAWTRRPASGADCCRCAHTRAAQHCPATRVWQCQCDSPRAAAGPWSGRDASACSEHGALDPGVPGGVAGAQGTRPTGLPAHCSVCPLGARPWPRWPPLGSPLPAPRVC